MESDEDWVGIGDLSNSACLERALLFAQCVTIFCWKFGSEAQRDVQGLARSADEMKSATSKVN